MHTPPNGPHKSSKQPSGPQASLPPFSFEKLVPPEPPVPAPAKPAVRPALPAVLLPVLPPPENPAAPALPPAESSSNEASPQLGEIATQSSISAKRTPEERGGMSPNIALFGSTFGAFAARPQVRCLPFRGLGYDQHWTVLNVPMVTRRPGLRLVEGNRLAAAVNRSDEELIEAIQRGEEHVSTELYERLVEVVDHTLFRVFGRREADHEDLMQASFEQIVRTLARRSYARACSLRTWASTIASHVGFNALRARRRERRVIDRSLPGDGELGVAGADAERAASARAELERVRAVLSELKPEQAQTLFLHDVLGHELAEIALITGVSVAAAQSRLVRGRRELYERIERDQNFRGRRRS